MTEPIDFSRYAGQCRAWTHRDAAVQLEIDRALDDELYRVAAALRRKWLGDEAREEDADDGD